MEDEVARKQSETMMPARLVAPVVGWLVRPDNTFNGEIFEGAAGRAAHNFVGSTKGYWNKDLAIATWWTTRTRLWIKKGSQPWTTPRNLPRG